MLIKYSSSQIKKIFSNRLLFLKDVAVFSLAQGIAGLALISYMFILVRLLGPNDYGLFQAVMGLYGLLIIFGSPLNIVTLHYVAKANPDLKSYVLGIFIRVALRIGIGFSALIIIFASYLKSLFGVETVYPFLAVGLLLITSLLLTTFYGGLQGQNRYVFFSQSKTVESFLIFGIGTLLVVLGLKVTGAVLGYGLGMLIIVVFLFSKEQVINLRQNNYSFDNNLTLMRKPLIMFGTLQFVENYPMIVARIRLTEEMAGLFGGLFSLRNIVLPFAFAIALPLYSHTVTQQEEQSIFLKALTLITLIATLFVAIGYFFPQIFIRVLYGNAFIEIANYLIPYGLYLFLHMVSLTIMFRQTAQDTVVLGTFLIPVLIVSTLIFFSNLSITTLIVVPGIAWIVYLGSIFIIQTLKAGQ